jgi:hypothetical protein
MPQGRPDAGREPQRSDQVRRSGGEVRHRVSAGRSAASKRKVWNVRGSERVRKKRWPVRCVWMNWWRDERRTGGGEISARSLKMCA